VKKNCDKTKSPFGISHWQNRCLSALHTPATLTGEHAPRSTLGAEPPKNKLAFAKNPLAEGARGRAGHAVPLNVLDVAAAIADEVVMPHALGIESRGSAFDGHFTYQARIHQVAQIVISGGPGRP